VQIPALESDRNAKVSSTGTAADCLNIAVLERLRAARGDYVPLDELGPDVGRVRDELAALLAFGFGIEQHPYRGAACTAPASRLCPDQIEHGLDTRLIGRRIAVWNRVGSTNDLALRAGGSTSNDGLVVLAEEQTVGRGRRGRTWTAPPRSSILMSIVLFPPSHLAPDGPETALGCGWLTALGAIATADVVAAWTGQPVTIKWPNDVRVGGRKIAGILVERARAPRRTTSSTTAVAGWGAVIGIGLNVNITEDRFPPELAACATSVQIERSGAVVDRSQVARDLIRRLDHWYDQSCCCGAQALNPSWRARSEVLGQNVQVATTTTSITGRLIDFDVCLGVTLDLRNGFSDPGADPGTPPFARLSAAEIRAIDALASDPSKSKPQPNWNGLADEAKRWFSQCNRSSSASVPPDSRGTGTDAMIN
jgi:BirA family transcriptional regulator, biotin operon repressor / biotin---[acetyl-CoA-carboxylase] ligase